MRTSSLRAALVVLACACAAAVACRRSDLDRGAASTTTTTSARPESTATSSRTIDNAGFVDNAGRTSEMTSRTTSSGMRATETGSERPTGTPGSGMPIPSAGASGGGHASETGRAAEPRRVPVRTTPASRTRGAPVLSDDVARLARARCDRATACDRVGPGRAFESQGDCMMQLRARSERDLEAAACQNGVDRTSLALCLGEVRKLPCDETDELANVAMCTPADVCGV